MSYAVTRAEYAALAVLELARAYPSDRLTSVQQIASKHNLSPSFLTRVLQHLRRAGLVETERGFQGGFRLLLKPQEIALGYVLSVVETMKSESKSEAEENRFLKSHSSANLETTLDRDRKSKASDRATVSQDLSKLRNILLTAEAKRIEYLNGILYSDLVANVAEEAPLRFFI